MRLSSISSTVPTCRPSQSATSICSLMRHFSNMDALLRKGFAPKMIGKGNLFRSNALRLAHIPSGLAGARLAALSGTLLLLSACARQAADTVAHTPDTPGFWLGVWHGFIFPVAWVISLFEPSVAVYAV